ncbi:lysine--tRNA ligase [Thermodesulfatator autotrophicus]|uniref:Lysine--tRNA ligase n=1 Tax=Thermodesulfatator autotrophicus TaxID=1795632 RepID=A0A177E969_9BACT|nr:lysine--tRNA ligase [Thermodesulfatator autotrophicus]OAG28497.1 lysine--tRNA ligase [Thermodesulfatator autotrophicus]
MSEESQVLKVRREKAEELESQGIPLFPNQFKPEDRAGAIKEIFGNYSPEELEKLEATFKVAGRLMARRDFGKAMFIHLQDETGRIQAFIKRDELGPEKFKLFKKYFDLGDIIGVEGPLFKTKTGELTILAKEVVLITKAFRPLPEKYHGLQDVELRYRRRYLDLIMNERVREIFRTRTRIVEFFRRYFSSQGFLEVETPMMQPIPGGATARPFKTYHHALERELYLRIAPELYLKRLLVGGFERVFELNRNFRNEGISIQHNPEFTMLEFYEAYATYEDLMTRTEEIFVNLARELKGDTKIVYQGKEIDFTPPWPRIPFKQALIEIGGVAEEILNDREKVITFAREKEIKIDEREPVLGKLWAKLFDALVEPQLIQPTFIIAFPVDISPLARRNEKDPTVADRFELFIAGREIANAFSELNDPRDQRARFEEQIKQRLKDDPEIHPEIDEDFIRALEYGMPPAAGEGIGIDRVVMLFTDSPSIREVILFPHLRPEQK